MEAVGRSHRFTPPKGGPKTMPTGFHGALGRVRFRWVVLGFQGTAGVKDAPNQRGNRQGRGRPAASMNDRCVAVFSMVDSGGNGLAVGMELRSQGMSGASIFPFQGASWSYKWLENQQILAPRGWIILDNGTRLSQ